MALPLAAIVMRGRVSVDRTAAPSTTISQCRSTRRSAMNWVRSKRAPDVAPFPLTTPSLPVNVEMIASKSRLLEDTASSKRLDIHGCKMAYRIVYSTANCQSRSWRGHVTLACIASYLPPPRKVIVGYIFAGVSM